MPDFIKRPPARSRAKVSRQTCKLTPEEWQRFEAERSSRWPREGFAFKFWKEVAAARDLDYTTIIGNPDQPWSFSALPSGHGKPWCWPMALNCAKAPSKLMHEPAIW